ncbi:hypothetical protein CAL29_06450 [Bordetella genomosp. 10]|uniref:Zinc-finger domain-containing protein n=1 Tax=Bordetella genomosp. 10 TaxID=1416804 RepID=A0A261SKQ4_9BORD|nr:hypothetical protein [Bordetella genomosp. 10]OZI37994.1 hypothetical protein CAL29_06450 [Bordetella genomosp. 10]
MSDERLLAYLSGEMTPAQRGDFEREMARDPALRAAMEQWLALAAARQLAHNDRDRPARFEAIMRQVREPAQTQATDAGTTATEAGATGSRASGTQATGTQATGTQATRGWLRRLLLGSGSPGLGLPLGWATAAVLAAVMVLPMLSPSGDRPGDRPLTRGAEAACPRLRVNLPDDLAAARLRETLTQYAVTVVSGPDADGYFVFAAKRESSLHDAAVALGASASAPLAAGACPAAGQ